MARVLSICVCVCVYVVCMRVCVENRGSIEGWREGQGWRGTSKQAGNVCAIVKAAAAAAAVRRTVLDSPLCVGCCLLGARHCQVCVHGQGQGECQTVPLTLLPIILLSVSWWSDEEFQAVSVGLLPLLL